MCRNIFASLRAFEAAIFDLPFRRCDWAKRRVAKANTPTESAIIDIMGIRENVTELIALVEQGRFLEAIERFYAEDASMQENLDPPRLGLGALLENERQVLAARPGIHIERVGSFLADGDRAAINWIFEYSDPSGRTIQLDEIAYQEWSNGKIIRERFYYDPAQRQRGV
jgi:hypothetical protein